jgi:hypothetical protein
LNKRVVDDPSYFFGYSTDEMNNLFPPHRSPTDHICSSIKDVLELNQSKANSFDDENVNICVASFIPDSFGNNKSILELGSNILSFNTSHYSNWVATPTIIVNGSLNVAQDMVGDILLDAIRREMTIWLGNILAILLLICLNFRHMNSTSSIALTYMSNVIMLSTIIGNRDFSGVWADLVSSCVGQYSTEQDQKLFL